MRVIAGEFRSRTLVAPRGDKTRPTTDRARETLFNVLAHLTDFANSRVLDIFAGSGALGIEAISRGAQYATFVENDRVALDALQRNITTLGITDRCVISRIDVYRYIGSCNDKFDLILSDAPYSDERARQELPDALKVCLSTDGVLVIEHRSSDSVVVPTGLEVIRELKAGEAGFTMLRHKA